MRSVQGCLLRLLTLDKLPCGIWRRLDIYTNTHSLNKYVCFHASRKTILNIKTHEMANICLPLSQFYRSHCSICFIANYVAKLSASFSTVFIRGLTAKFKESLTSGHWHWGQGNTKSYFISAYPGNSGK